MHAPFLEIPNFRLLGLVNMLCTSKNFQLFNHFAAQTILREHTAHSGLQGTFRFFSHQAGNSMGRGMAIVVVGGLLYATLMTLFIIPVMYDIFYRKQPHQVDIGEDDLDEILDEAQEYMRENEFDL